MLFDIFEFLLKYVHGGYGKGNEFIPPLFEFGEEGGVS
jgi:hypothetical protein